jgi:pre-mRNA-splicing factor CDC5/CEF1
VSDAELEQIARLGDEAGLVDEVAEGAGGDATRALLGNYTQTPARFATPMRTPRTAAGGGMDRVMMEAQNLARMQNMQTPLLGGENPELHASDYSGVTPKPLAAATPNPLAAAATPGRGGPMGGALVVAGATPSVAGGPASAAGPARLCWPASGPRCALARTWLPAQRRAGAAARHTGANQRLRLLAPPCRHALRPHGHARRRRHARRHAPAR